MFRESIDKPIFSITPESIDKFTLIETEFGSSDIQTFISQYISKLSHLENWLIDPSNFCHSSADEWIGLAHYRALLSVDRITDEVLLLLTEDTPFLRKMALFRILDQLAGLVTENTSDQSGVFKQFLLPTTGDDPIAEGLSTYKGKVGAHLNGLLDAVRGKLRDTVMNSVYIPGVVDRANSVVNLLDHTSVSIDEYVTGTVRELRNSAHGYYTRHFDKYLV